MTTKEAAAPQLPEARKAFEKWAAAEGLHLLFGVLDPDDYDSMGTRDAWHAWQAGVAEALAKQAAEVEALRRRILDLRPKPYDGTTTYDAYCLGHRAARMDAADLVDAAIASGDTPT
jgi:hypothetical protein